jgi:hypothetical protein
MAEIASEMGREREMIHEAKLRMGDIETELRMELKESHSDAK